MDIITIPITDFLKKPGYFTDLLPNIEKISLMKDGRHIADIKASPEEKNKQLLELMGTFDKSLFANEEVWKAVSVRRNRKKPIKL